MVKEKKMWLEKECKKCKKVFTPWNYPQNYCGDPCLGKYKKTIAEANAEWVLRDEESKILRYRKSKDNFNYGDMRII